MCTIIKKSIRYIPKYVNSNTVRYFRTNPILSTFHIDDDKDGYRKPLPPVKDLIRTGLKEIKGEIKLWSQEMKEKFENDPIMFYRPGETDVQWDFKSKNCLDNWVVTCDSDHGEGYSTATLKCNEAGKAVFAGELSTRIPKDGKIQRAGYCNMSTIRFMRSFKRATVLDWSPYNLLVLKVRGDGRSYAINIGARGFFDLTWHDLYSYVLYTRGGPYWQVCKIPFSKFILSSRGRIQDNQSPLPTDRVTKFVFMAADKIEGPFSLEIDYIGLERDPNHEEEFAYEMYKTDNYIANV